MSLHEGGRQTSERVDSFATLTERPDTINKVDLAPLKIRALYQRLCNTIEHCHGAQGITTSQCPSLHPPTALTTNLQRLAEKEMEIEGLPTGDYPHYNEPAQQTNDESLSF